MKEEIYNHLTNDLIPFWKSLIDKENGGFYGYMDFNRHVDRLYEKGCILNSRITWFFANAYTLLKDPILLEYAKHGYEFMKCHCIDPEFGGVYWSLNYDGTVKDSMKHTYNQGFAIYALSSYYEASGDTEALELAMNIFDIVEAHCKDEYGYTESFSREFSPAPNIALSENGVIAEKTMNTLLHVVEGYTELYRVSGNTCVKRKLEEILDIFATKIFNPTLKRQEVFFDKCYNSIIDLHSFGHDIETSWLLDRTAKVLGEEKYEKIIYPLTTHLCEQVYASAYDGNSLSYECDKGTVNEMRIWWVEAETVLGFLNQHEKEFGDTGYLKAAESVWDFIKKHFIDNRIGGPREWFYRVDKTGKIDIPLPLVEPWKCPYHNGRMCFEILKKDYL